MLPVCIPIIQLSFLLVATGGAVIAFQPPQLFERIEFLRSIAMIPLMPTAATLFDNTETLLVVPRGKKDQQVAKIMDDDQSVVRRYAGVFLEKMINELNNNGEGGFDDKGVEHVYRNLSLFLSPPVTALDGGGVPLSRLRDGLDPGIADRFDALSLNGARLADAILSEIPSSKGKSSYDPGRVLIRSREFVDDDQQPSKQVDSIFISIWAKTPLETFKVGG
jgi:hypothetical protein